MIRNLGNTYPVKARIIVTLAQGQRNIGLRANEHYNGAYLWNLNPLRGTSGHFEAIGVELNDGEPLRARIDVTLIDVYERGHPLLPVGYIKSITPPREWYFEPALEALEIPL